MGMVVQHNVSAMNANNAMGKNVAGLKKSTEKLSTGYQINRAADNAAGLAISEKMRSQIRGLSQATNNANDAISLIQTAEGGLQESEDIMQRMRELAVQSANGTYTDEDREQIQYEVDALKEEVDRIASATEFNEMKLLDGSLSGKGSVTEFGPRYGVQLTQTKAGFATGTVITSNISGVKVTTTTSASGKGGENAYWNAAGTELTLNLVDGQAYDQQAIDKLVADAKRTGDGQTANLPDLQITLKNGVMTPDASSTGTTVAGERATITASLAGACVNTTGTENYADAIRFTANSYGDDTRTFKIAFDVAAGKENVTAKADNASSGNESDFKRAGEFTIHLATGVEYTGNDIEKILAKEGLDYSVEFFDSQKPDGDTTFTASKVPTSAISATLAGGAGVYKDAATSTGEGLTFQIGANGVEDQRLTVNVDDMSSNALGIKNVDVSTQDGANAGINKIDDAIKKVSTQRAKLGAVQNRLEHTVNSLNTANENLTAAESQIRDTDMAAEMIKYTKSNILQQASQSMLAQANQQPQGVLQLLG